MKAIVRGLFAATATLAALGVVRTDAGQGLPGAAGRFTSTLGPLVAELTKRLSSVTPDTEIARIYNKALAFVAGPSATLQRDISDARGVFIVLHSKITKYPEMLDAPMMLLLEDTADALDPIVDQDIADFEGKVADFEQDNPGVSTTRQHKALTKARDALDKSRLVTNDPNQHLVELYIADAKLDPVRRFDHVFTPPKGKCGTAAQIKSQIIRPGEFCHGQFLEYDFDTHTQLQMYFEANKRVASTVPKYVSAAFPNGTPRVDLYFEYCDGQSFDLTELTITLIGPGPSYSVSGGGMTGGFRRGLGFGSNLGSGVVTITSGTPGVNGVLTGTFTFDGFNDGSGSGTFRVYIGL